MRVETESKYYCIEPEKLIDRCEKLGLKRVNYITENDEYFTDLDSLFIRNRTCLRIRNTNNKEMEITFKGKSLELLGQYSKIENNIKALTSEYDKYVGKILKNYDRLIVESRTNINLKKYNTVNVKSFTELLDVRDNLKLPIIYFNIVKHEKGMFYIKDGNDIYVVVIKDCDLKTDK